GKVRHQLKRPPSLIEQSFLTPSKRLVFSPDGNLLAAGGDFGTVLIWSLTTGKLVGPELPEVFEHTIRYVDGGKRIVVGYMRSPVQSDGRAATGVWEVATGRQVLTLPEKALADVSATGELLAVFNADPQDSPKKKKTTPRQAEVVDLASGKTLWHSTELGADLRFSRDGKKLAGFGPAMKVLDARTGKELSRLKLQESHAVSPDLSYAVRADLKEGKLRLLELASGRQLWQSTELPKAEQEIHVILFSPDDELLAVHELNNNHFFLWQTKTGKQLLRSQPDGRLLGFLPDCRTLLFQEGEDDGELCVRTFRLGQKTSGHGFSGYTRTHPLWMEENRAYFQEFFDYLRAGMMTFQRDFGAVASRDSKLFVTAAEPFLIQVWETATGKLLCRLQGDRDGAHLPVLSPDCRTLTTRNANGTITVWDLTGLRLAEQKEQLPVSAAEFERCWASFA
ncbi:MAG: WD40 repeat domain-containing protein, partial [Acidobacteria bacterium]|nr:WD40 repeat domain-containing protein [Acidobacteriota bacterium]